MNNTSFQNITTIPNAESFNATYAQQQRPLLPATNNEEWKDKESNTKVSFSYSPKIPTVERYTELKFTVEGLNNSTRLKDVYSRLTLIDVLQQQQQVPLKSYNLTAPDGYFSIKYRFPHEGTYQIIVKVNSKDSALTLASFKLIVPFQPFGVFNINHIFPLLIPVVLVGIIGAMAILAFIIVVNKRQK
jgi:hypothetical protein